MNLDLQHIPLDAVSRPLAPEDIRPGLYVAPLFLIHEHCLGARLFDASAPDQPRVVRVAMLPAGDAHPVRVVDVSLPFVLIRSPNGRHSTLDVRTVRLARVSDRFGRTAFRQAQLEAEADRAQQNE